MPKGRPGHPKTDAHREKLRAAARQRFANQETRRQHADRMREVYQQTPALHHMHTEEAREKQGHTLRSLWETSDYRDKQLAQRRAPENRTRASRQVTIRWADPVYREQQIVNLTQRRRAHLSDEAQRQLEDAEWLRQQNTTHTITEIAESLGCSQSMLSGQYAKFGIVPLRHPSSYAGGENRIVTHLRQYEGLAVLQRDRTIIPPYEIDVYLPDHGIGIEYHGSYWHSYDRVETADERRRHYYKYQAAQNAGIRLLQFFDFEWARTPHICAAIIDQAMRRGHAVGARSLTYRVPLPEEVRDFLNAHHLQGACGYTHAAGLYDGDTLIMVMTLGASRFRRQTWELVRLATRGGWHVTGGASRLWTHLCAHLPHGAVVRSYADCRVFTGTVYTALGFTYHHRTPPGYQYVLGMTPYSRMQFQKHRLASQLANFDPTLTEAENMFAHGYRRLWDAGQLVFEYIHP